MTLSTTSSNHVDYVWLCPSDDFAVSAHINIIWHATKYADLVIGEKGIMSTKFTYKEHRMEISLTLGHELCVSYPNQGRNKQLHFS